MPDRLKISPKIIFLTLIFMMGSCKKEKSKQQEQAQLYNKYCASCHLAPKIEELTKEVWKKSVLPALLERMDVEGLYQDPVANYSRPKD